MLLDDASPLADVYSPEHYIVMCCDVYLERLDQFVDELTLTDPRHLADLYFSHMSPRATGPPTLSKLNRLCHDRRYQALRDGLVHERDLKASHQFRALNLGVDGPVIHYIPPGTLARVLTTKHIATSVHLTWTDPAILRRIAHAVCILDELEELNGRRR